MKAPCAVVELAEKKKAAAGKNKPRDVEGGAPLVLCKKKETAAGKDKPLVVEGCCAEKRKLLREKMNRWTLRIVVQKKGNCCGKK